MQERAKRRVVGWSAAWLCMASMQASAEPQQGFASEHVERAVERAEGALMGELFGGEAWRVTRQEDGGWSFEGEGGAWSAASCEARDRGLSCQDVVFRLGGRVGVSQSAGLVKEEIAFEVVEMRRADELNGVRMRAQRAAFSKGAWQRMEGLKRESQKKDRR